MRHLTILAAALIASPVYANSFLNGGFEDGNTGSWTVGAGDRTNVFNNNLNASNLLPGGSLYNASRVPVDINVVGAGFDSNLGGTFLPTVFAGANSLRVGDLVNGGFAGAVTQTVVGYGASTLNFSWAAVLDAAHGANDAPVFKVAVRDVTAGTTPYSVTFAAFPGSPSQGLFQSQSGFVYAPWQSISVNTTIGNTYTIELLAADCELTGHAGYAYLDGFGSVVGGGGDNGQVGGSVPLPGSLALLGVGAALMGLRRKA